MHVYRSSATIIAWRQAGDPPADATTVKRAPNYKLRTRGLRSFVGKNVGVSSGPTAGTMTAASGAAACSFSGASVAQAAVTSANGVSAASMVGSSRAAGAFQADGQAAVSFSGSAIAAGSVLATGSSTTAFSTGDAAIMAPAAGSSVVSFTGMSFAAGSLLAPGASTAAFGGESVAASMVTPAAGSAIASFIGEAISEGGGTADPAAVWNYTLSNGKTAQQTVVELHAMMSELYRIHGLAAGEPLIVDKTTRTAGGIEQSISQVGDVVTVTRTG